MINDRKTIYIVTPCRNMSKTINQTILSIVSQEGDFSIRYHVQDGGSTDGTIEILKKWEQRLSKVESPFIYCNGVKFTFESKADKGMYHAIEKGFSSLDIPDYSFMTWLNADDKLLPQSLMLISSLQKMQDVNWITGNLFNFQHDNGMIFNWFVPFPPAKYIARGVCDLIHWACLEQEGTFWRKWLWDKVGGIDTKFKFAGDWDLWRRFANNSELIQVAFPLGAFRKQEGQLSAVDGGERYRIEIDNAISLKDRKGAIYEMAKIGTKNLYYKMLNYAGNRYTIVDKKIGDSYPPWCKEFVNKMEEHDNKKNNCQKEKTTKIHKQTTSIPKVETSPDTTCPTFFIVTPCLNAASKIDQAIRSVVTQAGQFLIRYHIQDRCSTDKTIECLKRWENVLNNQNGIVRCKGVKFTWSSESNNNVYDDVIKSFDTFFASPEDFMTWINSEDHLLPEALSTILRAARDYPNIDWMGGPQDSVETDIPMLKRNGNLSVAVTLERLHDVQNLKFSQLEGIFFKKRLWFKSKHALKNCRLGVDWSLFQEIERHGEFLQLEKPLGIFHQIKEETSDGKIKDYKSDIKNS